MQRDSKSILILGDSLTEGFRLPPDASFPSVLQERLDHEGYSYRIINGGKAGDSTGEALIRLPAILKSDPDVDILIIFLGANDFFDAVPPEQVKENLRQIIFTTRNEIEDIEIYLVPFPALRTMVPDYEEGFNSVYKEIAEETNVGLLPFIMDGVFGVEEMNQADRVHPNEQGARIMGENIFHLLKDQNIIRH